MRARERRASASRRPCICRPRPLRYCRRTTLIHMVTCSVTSFLNAASAPPLRTGHTANLLGDEIIIVGGMCDGECTSEVLVVHAETGAWRSIRPNGTAEPKPRLGHATCTGPRYDDASKSQLWLFGGGDGRLLLNDLWTLERGGDASGSSDGWRWVGRSTSGKATGRMGHSLVHLPSKACLLSFGGFVKGIKGGYATQVLLLELSTLTWSEPTILPRPSPTIQPIRGRLGQCACVLGDGHAVLLFGGSAGLELLNDVILLRTDLNEEDAASATTTTPGAAMTTPLLQSANAAATAAAAAPPPRFISLTLLPAAASDPPPRPRAHAALLHVPPYVLHLGGCSTDDEAPIDMLYCPEGTPPQGWGWREVTMADSVNASAFYPGRRRGGSCVGHATSSPPSLHA